jgi:tricorn protease
VLDIRLAATAPQARPQWKDAGKTLTQARLSSTGKRVVEARGEVFTVPVKDGTVRNLTESAGVREKDALWSPDGQRVAYISDAPACATSWCCRPRPAWAPRSASCRPRRATSR